MMRAFDDFQRSVERDREEPGVLVAASKPWGLWYERSLDDIAPVAVPA
jgi:hypothetical protein